MRLHALQNNGKNIGGIYSGIWRTLDSDVLFFPAPKEPRRFAVMKSFADYCFMRREKMDLPSVHGEISVEHLFAHLFPLNSAGKFQVRELVSQQVRLHETLDGGEMVSKIG